MKNITDTHNQSPLIHPVIPPERKGIKALLTIRKDPLNYFVRLMEQEKDYAWFQIGPRKVLMLNDAAAIKQVFQTNFESYRRGEFNKVLAPLMGRGIFLTEKDLWKKQRKESAPVFANGNFPEMTRQIVSAAHSMIKRWDEKIAHGKPVDVNIEIMWFTLDVVLRALYHEDREAVAVNMKNSLGTVLSEAESRIWAPVSLPQNLVLKLPKYQKAFGFLHGLVGELIETRRQNGAYPDDLLSHLVQNYGDDAEDQRTLRDQVMSFLLAGHETTANGLAWCWYEIGKRPDILQKIRQEVDAVMGQNDPDYESTKKLGYTRQVFNEALRMYPPVWTMSRDALVDDVLTLEDGRKLFVPKGACIMLCDYAVHRYDRYWEDPEAFMPERFAPEALQNRDKFSWFPFGAGPRLCLGFKFAEIESLAVIAMIVQRYEMSMIPGQDIKPQPIITLRPDKPIFFKVRHRQKEQAPPSEQEFAPEQNNHAACPFKAA